MARGSRLLAVIKREYLERVRNKWFIVGTLLGPVFILAIGVLPGLMTVRNMRAAQITDFQILDATGTELGTRIATTLRERAERDRASKAVPAAMRDSLPPLAVTQVMPIAVADLAAAESTATRAVMAEQIRGYMVLDTATLRTARARYAGRNASSLGEMEQVEAALRGAMLTQRLQAAGITGARADSLTRLRADLSTERITSRGRGGSGLAGFFVGFLIAILLYMMILLYGQAILRGVMEEKTTRVAEVVIASISPDTLLAGKVIGVGAVGLTQQLIWLAFGLAGSVYGLGAAAAAGINITMPQFTAFQVITLMLFFLLGYTFYAALFAAVGAMCNSQEDAQQAAFPVMMPLIASVVFMQPILTTPTGTLANVMSTLPISSPIIMPMIMSATQVPVWHVLSSLALLAVSCLGTIWVSARIYRVGLLMTGKRPSLKELVRWVKYA
jgi:ABC-2 type transport system permease protein